MTERTPTQRALDADAQVVDLARENERLREALTFIESAIRENITENGRDKHRMKIGDTWHTGQVVDVMRNILRGIQEICTQAIGKDRT